MAAFGSAASVGVRASKDVIDPHITSPSAGSVWVVGTTQTVTWDTTGTSPSDTPGKIELGFIVPGQIGENLGIASPLATNIDLTTGSQQVTVPDVPPGTTYIVVLFGDSGNASEEFTIA
ncbi:hypothetical protein BC834DRAFT_823000 [Gloeopeniophorella convolvens]|nr:hypothetical protein BC834DRAFT_823000 [Gloeopeniophorella convolvens]